MFFDISNYGVIDDHCHPFDPNRETMSFEQYWSLSMLPLNPRDMKNVLTYQLAVRELGKFLGMGRDVSEKEILEERNRIYKADQLGYMDKLFRAGNVEGLLLDIGYPAEEFVGYSVDIDQFSKILPIDTARIIERIEPILYRYVKQELPFTELLNNFNTDLDDNIRKHKAVALKTVIAYFAGLEVTKPSQEEAAKAYDRYRENNKDKAAEKVVRDFFLLQSLDASLRYDIPIQFHTGMGDSPIIDMRYVNPILLFDIITDEHYGKVKYILIHSGYPHCAETGFLVNSFPNVYVDLSEMNPFAGIGIEPKLLELMEMAPMTKILYGSDAYNIPELFWFSSVNFKKVFGRVLGKLIDDDVIDEKYAHQIADWILVENAKRVYCL